ncbi:alginate export family protein [Paraferrimonas sedimenticola]|uniref:Alginate export domain-containing protein n=1 Tax=Paraferrimonas sedimenticola TaxID=375674 RepID=A0AA37RX53_9GAMM|nr:alginate export family protein [Paraferrimonas sedimenticola]GLP97071.1 hypothetical protein GCM10007895_23770 [Paraferrimonas sedimenticola]
MFKLNLTAAGVLLSLGAFSPAQAEQANTFTESISKGKASLDVRLRYEGVNQDNDLKDANAVTVRTLLGYTTADFYGFSAMVELEDSRPVAGLNKYNDGLGSRPDYSVIADPKTTEVDQAFVQYRHKIFNAKLGRQVLAIDNQRFVGHVGWRQDRQTFDAISVGLTPIENLSASYSYVGKRNRIFAQERDVDSKDHLFNLGYNSPIGKISGYGYLLEVDNRTKNSLDSYGIRLDGNRDVNAVGLGYQLEYARQRSVSPTATFNANYMLAELKVSFKPVAVHVGFESLGSDKGEYGFSTPLATLHKFNGWADQFLTTPKQGLRDIYAGLGGNIVGLNWAAIYHNFSADKSTDGVKNLGNEIDLQLTRQFNDIFSGGIKFAAYRAGDAAAGKVNTNKVWVWTSVSF